MQPPQRQGQSDRQPQQAPPRHLSRLGFDNIKVSEVADRVGVSVKTIYNNQALDATRAAPEAHAQVPKGLRQARAAGDEVRRHRRG